MPTEKFPIDVAASVIADISSGIYRTPAGALKELISNAFDADATVAHISTNSPNFSTFTCTDDGSGLTPERFKTVMSLIGGSSKRDQGEVSPVFKRPLIGRIGIGLLSIGQICRTFEIFSSAKGSPKKFRARIDLEPYMRPEARRQQLGTPLKPNEKVRVGDCEIEVADEEPNEHYTRVVMEEIIPGFQKQLRSQPMVELGVTPKTFKKGDMRAFLKSVSKDTVSEHGAYAQLIWELAVTAPVKYLPEGPARNESEVSDLRNRMEEYKFKVFLDGVELYKPILLPYSSSVTHKTYPHLDLQKKLSDSRTLRVRGYLYWQNTRILPRELQGVLVRVRNVGIGAFDPMLATSKAVTFIQEILQRAHPTTSSSSSSASEQSGRRETYLTLSALWPHTKTRSRRYSDRMPSTFSPYLVTRPPGKIFMKTCSPCLMNWRGNT